MVISRNSFLLPSCLLSQINDNYQMVQDYLLRDGCVLITADRNDFEAFDFYKFTSAVLGTSNNYLGGTSPRRQVQEGLYEATRLPLNYSITLHQEMSYLNQMPRYICFFSAVPALSGGASLLGDMTQVIDALPRKVWSYFKNRKLRLKRVLFGAESHYYLKDIHKSWQEVFSTSERGIVEETAKEKGWQWRWLNHDALELLQDAHPSSRYHQNLEKEVWCNQVHTFHLACQKLWAIRDKRENSLADLIYGEKHHPEYLDQMVFDDGNYIDSEMAMEVFHIIANLERQVVLKKGDILILDNLRFGHGRQPFKGARQIFVTLHLKDLDSELT